MAEQVHFTTQDPSKTFCGKDAAKFKSTLSGVETRGVLAQYLRSFKGSPCSKCLLEMKFESVSESAD